ncbi:MAG: hypothetical protein H6Q89_3713 [Myxococcaceae bacterium]|nr:hypothetical protein [Myxococcaceae bacterium]
MIRGLRVAVALALALAGCKSDEVKSAAHQLSWKPPRGVSLSAEHPGGLSFTGGVELYSIAGAPVPLGEEGQLDTLLLTALGGAKVEPLPKRISGRLGDIPAGKVARWVLAGNGQRALHYYLPLKDRYLLISMTTGEAAFGAKESQLDLSLSSLKIE